MKTVFEKKQEFRTCNNCNVLFRKYYGVTKKIWEGRKFCSTKCGTINRHIISNKTSLKFDEVMKYKSMGMLQKDIAIKLGITHQAVSARLNTKSARNKIGIV